MMNDLILYLYLIDILSNLTDALSFASSFLLLLLATMAIFTAIFFAGGEFYTVKPYLHKIGIPVFLMFCMVGLLKVTIPSTQTMYIALGLHTADKILQQPQVIEAGNQAVRILQAKLDEYEKELKQEKPND